MFDKVIVLEQSYITNDYFSAKYINVFDVVVVNNTERSIDL